MAFPAALLGAVEPEGIPGRRLGFSGRVSLLVAALCLPFAIGAFVGGRVDLGAVAVALGLAAGVQLAWRGAGQVPCAAVLLLAPWGLGAGPSAFAACAIFAAGLASAVHPPALAVALGGVGLCGLVASRGEAWLSLATALALSGISAGAALVRADRAKLRARLLTRDRLLQRYTLASEGAMTGLWHWDVEEDVVYLTPRAGELLGAGPQLVHPVLQWLERVDPGDAEVLRAELSRFASVRRSRFEQRVRVVVPGRGERTLLIRASADRDASGHAKRLAGSVEDVTAALRQESELLRSAFHDGLTGLANRALLLDRLAHAVAQGQRYPGRPFAVLFFDLDHFKTVNDSLGHQVGDALLREIATRLDGCVRPSDTLARLGGDEFVVLAHDLGVAQAEALAGRMLDVVRTPLSVMGHEVVASASVGVAPGGCDYTDPLDLLRDADTAMYRAKQDGRGRVCVFTEAMHAGAVLRLELERDMHRAVDRGEVEVHYQPILDLRTLKISGFEALVRWRRNGAMVPPDKFIPVAEETGQIVPMTWWILQEACSALAEWRRRGLADGLWLHVNFSGRHLSEGDAAAGILAVLERNGVPPSAVHIEVTETSVLRQGNTVSRTLDQLREAGIQLHLDDFGTGYASISYLHHWRFDGLKIDRSFISPIDEPGRRSIVAAIIQLARGLEIDVVAEGVETQAQADILVSLGCAYAQGWLWSRAVPSSEVRAMLVGQRGLPIAEA